MTVSFLTDAERPVLAAIAQLTDGNPFLPERIDNERRVLGPAFVETARVWHAEGDVREWGPNLMRLAAVVEDLAARLRERLVRGARPGEEESLQYEALVRYVVYQRSVPLLFALLEQPRQVRADEYGRIAADLEFFLAFPALQLPVPADPAHVFAWGYQIRRAFHYIYRQIFGGSLPSARLRAATWQSIFTHDARRGDLDAGIQVKLLRVLQNRTFQRIGETEDRRFAGKIIAATNRDLDAMMRAGTFRPDFYYRLCSDVIRTPALREQLADRPQDLANLVLILARRIVGDEEGPRLAEEVCGWVTDHLGLDYPWPGNVRELEQCVRNVLVRKEYRPPGLAAPAAADDIASAVRSCSLTAEDLLTLYCARAYEQLGSYVAVADRLGLDRRTVRQRVEKSRRN